MATIPRGNPGLAGGVEREDFTQFALLLSDVPPIFVEEHPVATTAAATTYALYSVVGLNNAGAISGLASNIDGSNAAGARGILAGQVVTVTSGTLPRAKLYKGGHFNMDSLVWHANFDNDAKREAAFRGAPAPVQIVVGANPYHRKT